MAPSKTAKSSLQPLPGRGLLDDEVELGEVVGIFGVKGELRVHLHSHRDSVLLEGPVDVVLIAPDGGRRSASLSCRPGAGKRILGRIRGVSQREQAAELMKTRIAIARHALPPAGEGEFYVADLQGLTVEVDGVARGRVVDVAHTAGGDLLELSIDRDVLFVAFASEAILQVDLEGGRLVLDPSALHEL